QRIHIAIVCQTSESRDEIRSLHPGTDKRLFVGRQCFRPTSASDYHVARHQRRVRHELREAWRPPVAGAVESIYKATGPHRLDGQEVSGAYIDRSPLSAACVTATRQYLITPEVEATFI